MPGLRFAWFSDEAEAHDQTGWQFLSCQLPFSHKVLTEQGAPTHSDGCFFCCFKFMRFKKKVKSTTIACCLFQQVSYYSAVNCLFQSSTVSSSRQQSLPVVNKFDRWWRSHKKAKISKKIQAYHYYAQFKNLENICVREIWKKRIQLNFSQTVYMGIRRN